MRDDRRMTLHYLSAEKPRVDLSDETAIEAAAEAGLLEETHYLDVKAAVLRGPSKNRELARDLASFAVDCGTLVIGVAEDKESGEMRPVPVELAGLAERVEQVARSIPDPPVPVACRVVPSRSQSGHGYVVVSVPATGTAPHMVDGVYMGRGDKTKIRLSDNDVRRLHALRASKEEDFAAVLADYVSRDPVPESERKQAHAFVVASPLRPRPEMLLDARPDGKWQTLLHQLLHDGAYATGTVLEADAPYDPSLRSVSNLDRRSDGAALTYNLGATRELTRWHDDRPPSEDAVELAVTEDGGLRVMTTRLGDDAGDGRGEVVFENILPDLVRRTVSMAARVADLTGYAGPWMFGVAAIGLAGKPAYGAGRVSRYSVGTFTADQDEYTRVVEASRIELFDTPARVTERLVGRFLRSVGFDQAPAIRKLLDDEY